MNEEKNKLRIGNFITIQGWMVTELNLKGNSLLIYAIIYGFSQNEDNYYKGSRQYLANWINSTVQGVSKCLKKLVEDGMILKKENVINGVKFCEYKAISPKLLPVNKVYGGRKQSLHNNIEDNIDNIYSANFDINEAFDKFWNIYPRKTNKKKARDLFMKKCIDENILNKIINAIIYQKKSEQWQNIKYIPHATTWLNGERWEDEVIISDNIQNTEKNNSDDWMKEYE